ncbi:MAG: serine/threonine-protein kinase, partial [Cyanobacteria bacterium J06555_13]
MTQVVETPIDNDAFLELPHRYKIQSLLGKQAGRRTFLAQDLEKNTLVVIKLVLFGPDFTWEDLKLFERETETLKSLDHPAIPKYLDAFEVETRLGKGYALVQTYIQAPSLKEIVDAGHRFRESQLQPMAQALLSILYYLHSCYPMVIHRDIKPSNILLKAKTAQTPAKLYLIDFGSVQTAQTDGTMTVVGTYGYMPPEQFGGRAKPASDLYSLGATLIYLATGKHPTELMQESLQIQFSEHVGFSESFTQWLATLTHTSLSARTATAKQALQQLKAPQLKSAGSESLLASGSTVAGNKALSRTLSRGDISIVVRPNEMEIQCLRSRIREPLRQRKSINELNKSDNLDSVGIVSALLTGSVSSCFCAAVILFINMWKTGINAAGFFAVLSLVQFIIVIAVISGVDTKIGPRQ